MDTTIAAKPSVAELKGQVHGLDDLVNFLTQIPTSQEAAILYALVLMLPLGMFASWLVKYAVLKTVDDGPISYFFKSHSRRTLGTVVAFFSACLLALTTGLFENDGLFTGWYSVFWTGLNAAFSADMGINKGTQGGWTESEREAERAKLAAAELDKLPKT